MPYEIVENPILGERAFQESSDAAILSRAAILLTLGAQLRGETPLPRSMEKTLRREGVGRRIPSEDLALLGMPQLGMSRGRIDSQRIREGLQSRLRLPLHVLRAESEWEKVIPEFIPSLADSLFQNPTPLAAAELMEGCLHDPQKLIQICSAVAYWERSSERNRLVKILSDGIRSEDNLTRQISATALARVLPEHSDLQSLISRQDRARGAGAASRTTVIIPGTWSLNSDWWQPGGDFQSYLAGVLPPLPRTAPFQPLPHWDKPYAAPGYYSWSGGYSDGARTLAAEDLVQWVNTHDSPNADFITHSHGGNVAMLATKLGNPLVAKEMVLLSCPVHFPKYKPNFHKVQKIVSIRVHLDLVILADRGGQRFNDPSRIQENILPVWFDHFATHNPAVWKKYDVPAKL